MPVVEYPAGSPFPGVIGRTADESTAAWPAVTRAPKGTPNVLFVVLDDTGYGQLGCYGSPIATPNFDALAANGLRFSNMHTTALCSPSRSCIVTGRNHHSNGMAAITELASGYPGYNGVMPFENGMLSEILVERGYGTYMVGKWHLTPSVQETAAGPYDRWPLGRGFQRFYGFLGGDTSQWYPDLVYDNHPVEPPRTPEQGYHLTEDLVDKSIEFITDLRQIDPDKPFYLNLCFGATHAPHHVAKEWADKYAGQFDDGWDAYRETVFARQKELGIVPADAELSRHDPDVPEWESLSPEARRLSARLMEVFAGFLSHTDHHLGRLLDYLREQGVLDNTIVMVISDNGASAEGGATGTTNEAQFFNNAQETLEESLAADRQDWRPRDLQPLPVGLDLGRQYAFPALEARDLSGRFDRSVHPLVAGGYQGPRRDTQPVRAHHRHGPHGPRAARHGTTARHSWRHPGADARGQLRRRARRSQRLDKAPHPILRDARPPCDLQGRLASGVPVARSVVRRGGHRVRKPNLRREAD